MMKRNAFVLMLITLGFIIIIAAAEPYTLSLIHI